MAAERRRRARKEREREREKSCLCCCCNKDFVFAGRRSRNDAVSKLNAFRADVLSGKAQLADLAAVHSDCNSAKRGGDLGLSRPEYMCSVFRYGFLWPFFSLFSCRLKMERRRIDGFL